MPWDSKRAPLIAEKPMIDPTERSRARIAIIRVIPRPTIAEIEALTMIPSIFRRVRNRLLISVKTMTTPTKAMIEAADSDERSFFNIVPPE
jgi:hypothetical protein